MITEKFLIGKTLVTISACIVLSAVTVPANLSAQVEDTTPPVLVNFSFSPTTIDVSTGPQDVTFTLRITDELSGARSAIWGLVSPSGKQGKASSVTSPRRISGDEFDGIYQNTITFPQYSEAGIWRLTHVSVEDDVENGRYYGPAELIEMGLPTELVVGVNQPPVADAGPDQIVLIGETATFDGRGSYDPDGIIVSYEWNFGDNTTGFGEITTHSHTSAGTFTVTLTVTDNNQATDTDILTVTVQTAVGAVQDLISDVEELDLPPVIERNLIFELRTSIYFLNRGRNNLAIRFLNLFIRGVERLSRRGILTNEEADELILSAQRIINSI